MSSSLTTGRTAATVCVLSLLLSFGCVSDPPHTTGEVAFEFVLYEDAVDCSAEAGCRLADGQVVRGEYHQTKAQIRQFTQRPEGGFSLHLEFSRLLGAFAELQLDVPMGSVNLPPRVTYSEFRGRRLQFGSDQAFGRIQLSFDVNCPCQVGRMELVLLDVGPDGLPASADDRERRVSQARLRRDNRPFCHRPSILPFPPGELVVEVVDCPVQPTGEATCSEEPCPWIDGGWEYGDTGDDGWWDEELGEDWGDDWDDDWGWEEWDDPGWEGDDWDDVGWEGDDWDDDGWDQSGWDDGGDDWGDDTGDDWDDDWDDGDDD